MRFRRWACLITVLAIVLSILPVQTIAVGPALASGNHVRWIDRIANLPDYASAFYDWLEANTSVDGALADPTKGTKMGSGYVHMLHELKGTVDVSASTGGDQIQAEVMAAVQGDAQTVIDYAFEVYGAFDRDHPEVFWLSSESQCGMSLKYSVNPQTSEASYELSVFFYLTDDGFDIRLDCYQSQSLIAAAATQRDRDIQRILADCPTSQSVAEQIRYLNHVLTHNNAYNSSVAAGNSASADPTAWKCVSALSGNTGKNGPVCEGYARAFKVLCDKLGIPCVLVEGYARGSLMDQLQLHMWNYVQVDGKWYAVDTTWNDPRIAKDENAAISGKENEKYLLIGSGTQITSGLTFSVLHSVRNTVNSGGIQYTNGPVLTETAYVFEADNTDPTVPETTEPNPTLPVDPDPEGPDPEGPDPVDPDPEDPDPVDPDPEDPDPVDPDPVDPDPVDPDPETPDPVDPDPVDPETEEPDAIIPEPDMPDNYMNVSPYRCGDNFTAPVKDGYVFAGWFTDKAMTEPLPESVTTGYAYACFVDEQVLSVKCQLTDGTTAQSEQTDLRLLTGINSLRLSGVTFRLSWEDAELVQCDLYQKLLAHDIQIDCASLVFGIDAAYFLTCTVTGIPQSRFDETITVTPSWYTLDGTFVTGVARTLRISDGFK